MTAECGFLWSTTDIDTHKCRDHRCIEPKGHTVTHGVMDAETPHRCRCKAWRECHYGETGERSAGEIKQLTETVAALEERNRELSRQYNGMVINYEEQQTAKFAAHQRITELESTVQTLEQQVEAKADYGYRMDALAEERLIEITALKKAVQLHLNTIRSLRDPTRRR